VITSLPLVLPFFTIGHSNRELDEFIGLLTASNIALVADVRAVPNSQANPHFDKETLRESLAARHISYEHMVALGGLRERGRILSRDVNGFWTNESFRSYADYALSAHFQAALEHLIVHGRELCCAIMCSETAWWRCRRRIVADHLVARGESVYHIVGEGRLVPASLTPGAVIQAGKTVAYPCVNRTALWSVFNSI
jgi:uncharacterized protein (DUF488 family)